MNATAGESFVIDRAGEIYPGLWISGMSVSATLGGPRMGPIFGGMMLSGKRVADAIAAALANAPQLDGVTTLS
jgi:thiamine thiazole synthase